ncbi:MAG TPA: outer membrane beta-barrel protein [Cyanophyceae cyanobacterium]
MPSCQLSSPSSFPNPSPVTHPCFPPKCRKHHLEIVGSLIVWIGLILSEPTWLASSAKAVTSSGSEIHSSVVSHQLPVDSNLSQNLDEGLMERTLEDDMLPEIVPKPTGAAKTVEGTQERNFKVSLPVDEELRAKTLKGDKHLFSLRGNGESEELNWSTASPSPTNSSLLSQNSSPSHEAEPSPINTDSEQPSNGEDPELGRLRLRELEPPPPPPSEPTVYLLGGVDYLRSNNIFSGIDPVDDGLFSAGLTLLAVPSLGNGTSLFAAVSGNVIRYSYLGEYDYNELQLSLGVRQQMGRHTYGTVGWSNRQLFEQDRGDRFLNEHSVYLELGRQDSLTQQLTLNTFYQFRLSFADPTDRSQVIHYLGASLDYDLLPSLQLTLDYQFALADFTRQERLDNYHQLLTRLTYRMSSNSQIYLFGGYSFGDSSDSAIDFDGLVFGIGADVSLPLF